MLKAPPLADTAATTPRYFAPVYISDFIISSGLILIQPAWDNRIETR